MSEEEKLKLDRKLWAIANALRGLMNPDELKSYILPFIFYKYLSERIIHEIGGAGKTRYVEGYAVFEDDNESIEAIKKHSIETLGYFLKPSELFHNVYLRSNSQSLIIDDLNEIFRDIEMSTVGTESEEDFAGLFSDLDLNSAKLGQLVSEKNKNIIKIMAALDEVDFDLDNEERDVLGDAYEFLIGAFAAGAGKTGGEYYTPQSVAKLLSKIVSFGKEKVKSVYDPTCGSGSLLLRVSKSVKNYGMIYGQEKNTTTYNLARMNMLMHKVHYSKFNIQNGDTLTNPMHKAFNFECIVANPPFSAEWDPMLNDHVHDPRFAGCGKLAPKTKADFAFVQHILFHLADNGVGAVVLPHGVLFRGSSEGAIRKYMIETQNAVDAVIGLPAGIFFGTGIPTCILVLKKDRIAGAPVLFIDASKDFVSDKTQNFISDEHIARIIGSYEKRESEDKYSRLVELDEIAANDYNLNIARYVDMAEDEVIINIDSVLCDIDDIAERKVLIDNKLNGYLREIGVLS